MKSQELLVSIGLLSNGKKAWNYSLMAKSLKISPSTLHSSIAALDYARLFDSEKKSLILVSLQEFLLHGLKYVFPIRPGSVVRGVPTIYSAPLLKANFSPNGDQFVWPSSKGDIRGQSIIPIHEKIPEISLQNPSLWELFAALDAIRIGRARERELGIQTLQSYIEKYEQS